MVQRRAGDHLLLAVVRVREVHAAHVDDRLHAGDLHCRRFDSDDREVRRVRARQAHTGDLHGPRSGVVVLRDLRRRACQVERHVPAVFVALKPPLRRIDRQINRRARVRHGGEGLRHHRQRSLRDRHGLCCRAGEVPLARHGHGVRARFVDRRRSAVLCDGHRAFAVRQRMGCAAQRHLHRQLLVLRVVARAVRRDGDVVVRQGERVDHNVHRRLSLGVVLRLLRADRHGLLAVRRHVRERVVRIRRHRLRVVQRRAGDHRLLFAVVRVREVHAARVDDSRLLVHGHGLRGNRGEHIVARVLARQRHAGECDRARARIRAAERRLEAGQIQPHVVQRIVPDDALKLPVAFVRGDGIGDVGRVPVDQIGDRRRNRGQLLPVYAHEGAADLLDRVVGSVLARKRQRHVDPLVRSGALVLHFAENLNRHFVAGDGLLARHVRRCAVHDDRAVVHAALRRDRDCQRTRPDRQVLRHGAGVLAHVVGGVPSLHVRLIRVRIDERARAAVLRDGYAAVLIAQRVGLSLVRQHDDDLLAGVVVHVVIQRDGQVRIRQQVGLDAHKHAARAELVLLARRVRQPELGDILAHAHRVTRLRGLIPAAGSVVQREGEEVPAAEIAVIAQIGDVGEQRRLDLRLGEAVAKVGGIVQIDGVSDVAELRPLRGGRAARRRDCCPVGREVLVRVGGAHAHPELVRRALVKAGDDAVVLVAVGDQRRAVRLAHRYVVRILVIARHDDAVRAGGDRRGQGAGRRRTRGDGDVRHVAETSLARGGRLIYAPLHLRGVRGFVGPASVHVRNRPADRSRSCLGIEGHVRRAVILLYHDKADVCARIAQRAAGDRLVLVVDRGHRGGEVDLDRPLVPLVALGIAHQLDVRILDEHIQAARVFSGFKGAVVAAPHPRLRAAVVFKACGQLLPHIGDIVRAAPFISLRLQLVSVRIHMQHDLPHRSRRLGGIRVGALLHHDAQEVAHLVLRHGVRAARRVINIRPVGFLGLLPLPLVRDALAGNIDAQGRADERRGGAQRNRVEGEGLPVNRIQTGGELARVLHGRQHLIGHAAREAGRGGDAVRNGAFDVTGGSGLRVFLLRTQHEALHVPAHGERRARQAGVLQGHLVRLRIAIVHAHRGNRQRRRVDRRALRVVQGDGHRSLLRGRIAELGERNRGPVPGVHGLSVGAQGAGIALAEQFMERHGDRPAVQIHAAADRHNHFDGFGVDDFGKPRHHSIQRHLPDGGIRRI